MSLVLDIEAITAMQDHCEETYPNEGCGFFFGREEQENDYRLVTLAQRVLNANEGDQRRRFRIDPDDYRAAERYATNNRVDLLGVYHSHPDHPAVPSEHDRKVAFPYFSYIIISVENGIATDVRSWRLNTLRQFEEESIRTTKLIRIF
jgi:proteasome lid subunit RPN8/RPN11